MFYQSIKSTVAALLWALLCPGLYFYPAAAAATGPTVCLAALEGETITPVTAAYLKRALERAKKEQAACLVIQLDTPGGLLETTRGIVKEIMNSPLPVVVYVAPRGARAGSAGVFITLSAHIAAMAPSTNIGAAHPVNIGGGGPMEGLKKKTKKETGEEKEAPGENGGGAANPMADKITNDAAAWIRAIARERGRNAEWAEKAVTQSVSAEAGQALQEGVIDLMADDLPDLLRQINGRKVTLPGGEATLNTAQASLIRVESTLKERLMRVIANPNVAYLLMLLGFYGLIFEFSSPGIGFPGIAGAICLILALFSFQALPTNYTGVALILLAVVLFVAEAKIISYGLLTLGGIICMFFGSLILFDTPEKIMRVSLSLVLPLVLATATLTIVLAGMAWRAHKRQAFSGAEGLIGEQGIARTPIAPRGKVSVHGEIWNAVSDEALEKGEEVIVCSLEKLRLKVKRLS